MTEYRKGIPLKDVSFDSLGRKSYRAGTGTNERSICEHVLPKFESWVKNAKNLEWDEFMQLNSKDRYNLLMQWKWGTRHWSELESTRQYIKSTMAKEWLDKLEGGRMLFWEDLLEFEEQCDVLKRRIDMFVRREDVSIVN